MGVIFWIAQLFGLCGIIFSTLSVQLKNRRSILIFMGLSSFSWMIHWFILGAITAAMTCLVSIVRTYHFIKYRDRNYIFWFYIFLLFIIAIVTYGGWITVFSTLGALFITIANWKKDEQEIRGWTLLKAFPWIAHNLLTKSYIGLLAEFLSIISTIIGLYRYRKPIKKRSK